MNDWWQTMSDGGLTYTNKPPTDATHFNDKHTQDIHNIHLLEPLELGT